jgi:hypothetical protein
MKQQTVREHHDASLACGHTHRVDRTLRRMAAIKNACSGPNCVASHKKKGALVQSALFPHKMTQNGSMSSYFSFLLNMEPNPDLASSSR